MLDELQLRILKDIRFFLYVFHVVQEIASAEKPPTLTLVLPLFETLRANLDNLEKTLPNLSHVIQASKAKLQDYIDTVRRNPVYSIATCRCFMISLPPITHILY